MYNQFTSMDVRAQTKKKSNMGIYGRQQLNDNIQYKINKEDLKELVSSIEYEQYLFSTYYSMKIEKIYDSMLKDNVDNRNKPDYWHYKKTNVELFFVTKSIRISRVLINIDPDKDTNDYNNVPPLDVPECIIHQIYNYMTGKKIVNQNKRNKREIHQSNIPSPKRRRTTGGMSFIVVHV